MNLKILRSEELKKMLKEIKALILSFILHDFLQKEMA